jgi:FkbM family methyltransferase
MRSSYPQRRRVGHLDLFVRQLPGQCRQKRVDRGHAGPASLCFGLPLTRRVAPARQRYSVPMPIYRSIRTRLGATRARWRIRRLTSRAEAAAAVDAGDVSTIRPGAHRLRVRAVQELVNQATTQKLKVDGVYGEQTIGGVAFLQRRLGLPADGIADTLTLVLGQARIAEQREGRLAMRHFLLQVPPGPSSRQHVLVRASHHLYVPRVLEERGLAGYEPETLAVWLAALDLDATGAVFDVGANAGLFSLLAAVHSGRAIVAFEPTPDLANTVRRIADENNLPITTEQIALGARTGVASLHLSRVSDASNSLASGFRPSTESLPVQVQTLDEYCRKANVFPGVLKIDTETTEADVLQGGLGIIREYRPYIICELLPGHRERDVPEVLEGLGYRYIHISSSFSPVEHRLPFGDEKNRNWLLAPESPSDHFWRSVHRWHDALMRCVPVQADM